MVTEVTIGIFILVISFAVILLAIFFFNWNQTIDREACHESVVIRASVPDVKNIDVVKTPLKCQTEKICVTTNKFLKGDCEKELGNSYITLRVSSDSLAIENEINAIVAEYAAEGCWGMMGAGKINVFSREFSTGATKACVVCSRISFDQSVINSLPDKENKKVNGWIRYFISTKMPDSDKTYWQYLTNSLTSDIPYTADLQAKDFFILDNPQKAVVFYEIKRSASFEIGAGVTGALSGLATGALIGSAVPVGGTIVGAGIGLVAGGVLGFAGYFAGDKIYENYGNYLDGWNGGDVNSYAGFSVVNYDSESLNNLKCSSFENLVS
jgi:hypothetical protein